MKLKNSRLTTPSTKKITRERSQESFAGDFFTSYFIFSFYSAAAICVFLRGFLKVTTNLKTANPSDGIGALLRRGFPNRSTAVSCGLISCELVLIGAQTLNVMRPPA